MLARGRRLGIDAVSRALVELWATSMCPKWVAAVSSLAAAASSTSSPRGSRCRCASSGSATRSTRCGPSIRPISVAPAVSTAATLLPASEFLLGADITDVLAARMARSLARLPDTLQADLARFSDGALG